LWCVYTVYCVVYAVVAVDIIGVFVDAVVGDVVFAWVVVVVSVGAAANVVGFVVYVVVD